MSIELTAELEYNPDLLGAELDKNAKQNGYISYDDFVKLQNEIIRRPRQPALPPTKNKIKAEVFRQVWANEYELDLQHYENKQDYQALLKTYPCEMSGYAQFLADNEKKSAPFLKRRNTIPVSEKHRQLHTYITGGTGSGKSEAIKSFVWHYLTENTSTAMVLLSPHSKICEEVAQMRTHIKNDRLVYINPDLHPSKFPCLNPFDIPNKSKLSDREAENYSESFRLVFEELLQGIFTEQMNALLQATIPVIVKLPNANIYHLFEFLEPEGEKVAHYIDFANKHFKNKNMLDFLNGKFQTDTSYNRTKASMLTRLHSLFGSTLMQAFLVGKTTVNLESLINQRKVIVFNISKGTAKKEWLVMGKLIIAMMKNLAFNREYQNPEHFAPCHFFIDECQNYITESMQEILEECRKYKLYLTLAQQTAGAGMSKRLFRAIMGNAGIKLTGRNGDPDTLSIMSKSTRAKFDELSSELSTGRFSLWRTALTGEKQKPPIIVTMPTLTLDDKQSMTPNQWEAVKTAQIKAFYRSKDSKQTTEKPQPKPTKKTAFDKPLNDEFLN